MLGVLRALPRTRERAVQELVLQTSLARALLTVKGYTAEVEQAYTRALELSEGAGEIPQLYPVLRGLSSLYGYLGDFERAAQMGERMLKLAESLEDASMLADWRVLQGVSSIMGGQVSQGLAHLEKLREEYDPDRGAAGDFRIGNDPAVVGLNISGIALWLKGFPDQSAARARQAIALANRLRHPYTITYAQFHTGLLHLWQRDAARALEAAQAMLSLAEEHQYEVWRAVGTCLRGAALTGLGRPAEGLPLIDQGLHMYQGLNSPPVFWPMLLQMQAEAHGLAGDHAQALAVLEKALALVPPNGGGFLTPELFRLKGTLLLSLSSDHAPEAQNLFERSQKIAQDLELPMLELRAAIRIYCLWHDQGQEEKGRRLLSQVYGRFTEGFETADLREAKALLEGRS
jgi:tetratricopeptide (TPR) repeat protein